MLGSPTAEMKQALTWHKFKIQFQFSSVCTLYVIYVVLQPLWWHCIECVIHHKQDVREEQQYIYVAQTSNNKRLWHMISIVACCYRCEALRTCHSVILIASAHIIITKRLSNGEIMDNCEIQHTKITGEYMHSLNKLYCLDLKIILFWIPKHK